MIDNQYVLALIPARGGSKGFPRKNLAKLAGRSLIEWAASAARSSIYVDRIVLSTDSEEIAAEGRNVGAEVPFRRPTFLATDSATSESVAMHALNELRVTRGFLVLLQPTSPLRSGEDIDACLELAARKDAPGCVSVSRSEKSPHWMFYTNSEGRLESVLPADRRPRRRQDAPEAFVLNGAIYVIPIERFISTGEYEVDGALAYVMPRERSVDIDCPEDLDTAARMFANRNIQFRT